MEIKFRRKDLVKAMHRLDSKCQEIAKALASSGTEHVSFDNDVNNFCLAAHLFKSLCKTLLSTESQILGLRLFYIYLNQQSR